MYDTQERKSDLQNPRAEERKDCARVVPCASPSGKCVYLFA